MKNSLPLASFLPAGLTSALLSLSLLATSYSLKTLVLSLLWSFWRDGAFGYTWVGKVYFLLSVSLSLLLKRRYAWFQEDSSSHTALRWLLRGAGAWLLAASASSCDLSFVFALTALWREPLTAAVDWALLAEGEESAHVLPSDPPSTRYSGQTALSEEEYRQQGSEHTAKALAALQQHLENNVSQRYDLTDRYRLEADEGQARLLERFAMGEYVGRPGERDRARLLRGEEEGSSEEEEDEDEGERKRAKRRGDKGGGGGRTALLVVLLCLLAAAVYRPVALGGAAWEGLEGLFE
jgi:hypothetical protein